MGVRKYLSSPPLTEAARLRLGDEAGPLWPAAWGGKNRLKICSEDWQNLNCGSACWSWTSRLQRVLFSVPWGFLKTWEHAIQQILLSKIPPDIKDCPSSLKLRQLKTAKMKHIFFDHTPDMVWGKVQCKKLFFWSGHLVNPLENKKRSSFDPLAKIGFHLFWEI